MKDKFVQKEFVKVEINETKKEQSLREIRMEVEKKKIQAVPSFAHKIKVQFKYMEKVYLFLPIIVIMCVMGVEKILHWNQMQQEIFPVLSSVMAFLGVFGAISISRIFAYHMGELEASCYFNVGEIIAIRMLLSGIVHAVVIILCSIILSGWIQHEFISILLYILTPFLISNCICFFILLQMKEKNMVLSFLAVGILCACIWMVMLSNSWIYEAGMIIVWSVLFIVSIVILCSEIRLMFCRVRKGEIICYRWN